MLAFIVFSILRRFDHGWDDVMAIEMIAELIFFIIGKQITVHFLGPLKPILQWKRRVKQELNLRLRAHKLQSLLSQSSVVNQETISSFLLNT